MENFCSLWACITYVTHKVSTFYQPCLQKNCPFNDYTNVKLSLLSASALKQKNDLLQEMQSMIRHLDRRIDMICIKYVPCYRVTIVRNFRCEQLTR